MRQITIGILAGMGPRSTAPFIEMIIDECQRQYGAEVDNDFPQMLILSQPTPFYLNRPLDHSAMKKSILSGLKKLENSGVSFIVMPCNTAHLYFDECQSEISVVMSPKERDVIFIDSARVLAEATVKRYCVEVM